MGQAVADVLKPVAVTERIQALDVVRGFALLGIFLMNIEWFNRPIADLEAGMAAGLSGIDYAASWLIHTFVRGKFWTMFSMLFGMGFAVMLMRATAAQRGFVVPYLRRIAALAVFGLLHGILIWTGDILLSYAAAAAILLLMLFGRWWHVVALAVAVAVAGFVFKAPQAAAFSITILVAGLTALYLREERGLRIAGRAWPLLTLLLAAVAVSLLVGGGIGVAMAGAQKAGGFIFFGGAFALLAWLSHRFRNPPELRKLRAGSTLYLVLFVAMSIGSGLSLLSPASQQPQPTAEQKAKLEKARAEHRQEAAKETQAMSHGSYAEAVALRSHTFPEEFLRQGVFEMMVLGVFLVGAWLIQSGVMVHPERHLDLFRNMAWIGLPFGTLLALISSFIATTHLPGINDKQYQLAMGLQMIGNLPMSLGYISVVVLLLQKRTWAKLLSWLAPAGRMALTNYLTQSVVSGLFFYGYGLGHWGAGRAWQVVFVFAVFGLQVLFSRWWLSRFRYGPMEWLWRWATYARRPEMGIA